MAIQIGDYEKALLAAARDACVRAAVDAYEDAGIRGLCGDGRWECAIEAMRRLDLTAAVEAAGPATTSSGRQERPPNSAK